MWADGLIIWPFRPENAEVREQVCGLQPVARGFLLLAAGCGIPGQCAALAAQIALRFLDADLSVANCEK